MLVTANPSSWAALLESGLETRIGLAAPDELLDYLGQTQPATGTRLHVTRVDGDATFQADLRLAVSELPELVRAHLAPRLLGVYPVRGLESSAVTDVIAGPDGTLIGAFVLVDVETFQGRSANEWATWRENTPFLALADEDPRVSVVIAPASANDRCGSLQYVLLHEFGHVLTAANELMPDWWAAPADFAQTREYRFLPFSWQIDPAGKISPLAEDACPRADRLVYYARPQLPAGEIPALYEFLGRSPFASLYGSTSVYEDFAECFCTYVHRVLLKRPHELQVLQKGRVLVSYESFWDSPRSEAKKTFLQQFLMRPARGLARKAEIPPALEALVQAPEMAFWGLAPFLRLSIAGADMRPLTQALLERANREQDNGSLWKNLSTAFFALGQQELGLSIQLQALQMQQIFTLPATVTPPGFRLLLLMAPGDLAENMPIDCLLEDGSVELIFCYLPPEDLLTVTLPDHDALMVAASATDDSLPRLQQLSQVLATWHRPVLNRPECIPHVERARASDLMQGVPGLQMPPTRALSRAALMDVVAEPAALSRVFTGCRFPLIIRPLDSHAGRDLARIADGPALAAYLAATDDDEYYVSKFIDYSGEDGLFRKFRVALVDGQAYASHMAVSSDWMVHYVNAGMYVDGTKRAEEARFMAEFDTFSRRHQRALDEIHRRMGLDYVCIDCAETRDGDLLLFEIDHAMVVHAMDSETLFPYKKKAMQKVRDAFLELLASRTTPGNRTAPCH